MKNLDEEAYAALTKDAKLIEEDMHGPKVLINKDGKVCKIFRCKRTFSSAKYYPYAQRFADNVESLQDKGIPTVSGCEVFRIPHLKRDIVVYDFLVGETLRDRLESAYDPSLIKETAVFIARLHKQGVYFRSLHFGNIVVLPEGTLGLIDVSDMKIRLKAVGDSKKVRNFKAFMRYEKDLKYLITYGFSEFLEIYLREVGMDRSKFELLLKFQRNHPAIELL